MTSVIVIAGCRVIKTYVDLVRFVSSETCDDSLRPASLQNGDMLGSISRVARKWWRGEGGTGVWWGDLMGARLLAELFETLLASDAVLCEFH